MKRQYRLELDGLRGVAVLAVCLYHLDFQNYIFVNGFLGVDVFFVLSGYLITRNLLSELKESNKVNFWLFFEKRVRRVLPVLFFVCLLFTLVLSPFLLPAQFIDLSNSALAAETIVANFYWYLTNQQYSVQDAELQPLLHTWSLSLEEQFYLLAPVLLLYLYKFFRQNLRGLLFAIAILSFLANVVLDIQGDPADLSFYMLPFRFWQFLAGAIIAGTEIDEKNRFRSSEARHNLALTGLIILSVVLFMNQSVSVFSSVNRLAIVIGSALILWVTKPGMSAYKFLTFKPLRYLGLISYSVYLWHYPIFYVGRILNRFSTLEDKTMLAATTLLVATGSYFAIEKIFRNRGLVSCRMVSVFLIGVFSISAAHTMLSHRYRGFPERFGEFAEAAAGMNKDRERYWEKNLSKHNIDWNKTKDKKGVVIGNSFALDIAVALNKPNNGIQVIYEGMTGHNCRAITLPSVYGEDAKRCRSNLSRIKRDYSYLHFVVLADNFTFVGAYDREAVEEMKRNIVRLRDGGFSGPIILVGNRPIYDRNAFEIAAEYGSFGNGLNIYAQQFLVIDYKSLLEIDAFGKKTYALPGVYYLSLVDALCDGGVCELVNENRLLYHDNVHLSSAGADYIEPFLLKEINEIVEQHKKEQIMNR